ncbi:MAG: SH3 domain-containing protein [Acholeplasmataceae bacterium]|nr:SH3 domain-containing protein [Acholeplasmataceae bacterium]
MNQFDEAIQKSIDYLNSEEAKSSLNRDTYWPKWDSPWWHILLLHELGLIKEVPEDIMNLFSKLIDQKVLHFFPFTEDEMPKDTDPYREILCFCAAGSIYQMLFNYGIDVDSKIPWLRDWFTKYQLPDGGYNCNEDAYTKEVQKSSITSTLPVVEALLLINPTALELSALTNAADYIVNHQLFRKLSDHEIMHPNFTEIRFPRFYEYDYLRGFSFLYHFRRLYGYQFPTSITDEVEEMVSQVIVDGLITLKGIPLSEYSYNPTPEGKWEKGKASTFDLLDLVAEPRFKSLVLTKAWNEMKPKYLQVIKSYTRSTDSPIKLAVHEKITVIKNDLDKGWFLLRNKYGEEAWAPIKILRDSVIIQPYDSAELTAHKGDILKIYYEETGWFWCKNQEGEEGFIPKDNLESNG